MPYGITAKQLDEFTTRLASKLEIEPERVKEAMKKIVREDVNRIAKNKPEEVE